MIGIRRGEGARVLTERRWNLEVSQQQEAIPEQERVMTAVAFVVLD